MQFGLKFFPCVSPQQQSAVICRSVNVGEMSWSRTGP